MLQVAKVIDWVINPARVPKGCFEDIPHPIELNRCTCIVHDEQDKQRFMRDIKRTMSRIQVIRKSHQ